MAIHSGNCILVLDNFFSHEKLWRIFRRFTLVLLILLLVTVVESPCLHMERSHVLLRDQLVTAMNASLRGEVRIGRIEGGFWRTFTFLT
jgi:hypothetical protein